MWDVQRGPAPVAYYVIGVVVAMFVLLGLVMVLSASAGVEAAKGRSPYHIFTRQATWAAIGLVGMIVAMRMHLVWVKRLAIPLVVLAGLGMALPFVPGVGTTVNDARAWITLGSFSMQPSEFLKLALVLFSADLLVRRHDVLSDVRRSLRPITLVAAFAAGACLLQGDLGSAIVMTAIVLARRLHRRRAAVADARHRARRRRRARSASCSRPSTATSRFTAFLDIAGHRDHLSYQTYQGFLSIADGGLTGSGVGAGNGKLGLPAAGPQRLHLRRHRRRARPRRLGRRDRRVHAARVVRHPDRPRRRPTASACCSPAASRRGSACRPSSTSAASPA